MTPSGANAPLVERSRFGAPGTAARPSLTSEMTFVSVPNFATCVLVAEKAMEGGVGPGVARELVDGGYHINEGKGFNDRMMRSIKRNLGTDSFDLLPEIDPKVEEDVPPEASGINLEDFDMDEMDEFKQEL